MIIGGRVGYWGASGHLLNRTVSDSDAPEPKGLTTVARGGPGGPGRSARRPCLSGERAERAVLGESGRAQAATPAWL